MGPKRGSTPRLTDWLTVSRKVTLTLTLTRLQRVNIGKTNITSFMRKTVEFHFNYKLSNNRILRSQCVKDLGVLLDAKLYFHHHIDYRPMSSQLIKMLGLIRYITSTFFIPHNLTALYTTLVWPKLEYVSVAWNSITSIDSSKLEMAQTNISTLYRSRYFWGLLLQ
jgi:hypothetical protein